MRLGSVLWRLSLRARGVSLGSGVSLISAPIVSRAPGSTIRIGNDCTLISSSRHTALGVPHPVIIRTLRNEADISIGSSTGLSGATICAAVSVTIGARCLLGSGVLIFDTDFHALSPGDRRRHDNSTVLSQPTVIEDEVFIGANSIVTKGVRIGRGAVIGAGSVVTNDVPPGCVAAGNPARVLRQMPGLKES
jgi:acetyltransferase-like isoleucine patch superfamily enzyme